MTVLAYYLERVFKQIESGRLPELMRQSRVWEENKGKIHKIEHRKKNCRQEELSYMYDLPQLFSREILNTCEWRNYPDPGKEPMKELEKLIHEAQTRPEEFLLPLARVKNLIVYRLLDKQVGFALK